MKSTEFFQKNQSIRLLIERIQKYFLKTFIERKK
jgi:hypothetical protein